MFLSSFKCRGFVITQTTQRRYRLHLNRGIFNSRNDNASEGYWQKVKESPPMSEKQKHSKPSKRQPFSKYPDNLWRWKQDEELINWRGADATRICPSKKAKTYTMPRARHFLDHWVNEKAVGRDQVLTPARWLRTREVSESPGRTFNFNDSWSARSAQVSFQLILFQLCLMSQKASLHFCQECNNLLYPKADAQRRIIVYACRICQYSEIVENQLVYRNDLLTVTKCASVPV